MVLAFFLVGCSCNGTNCAGVFFDAKVKSIKVVDFCANYRVPLMEYLCRRRCSSTGAHAEADSNRRHSSNCKSRQKMQRILLSGYDNAAEKSAPAVKPKLECSCADEPKKPFFKSRK